MKARIHVDHFGTMRFSLDETNAPITVAHFAKLARSGFYDGLGFCRIVKGFVIQGGAQTNRIDAPCDETIKGEFRANGVDNRLKHRRGVLSMARAQDPNSAGTQFFIVLADAPHLDGEYAAFGEMIEGDDVLERLGDVETRGAWHTPIEMPIMTSIVIEDDDIARG